WPDELRNEQAAWVVSAQRVVVNVNRGFAPHTTVIRHRISVAWMLPFVVGHLVKAESCIFRSPRVPSRRMRQVRRLWRPTRLALTGGASFYSGVDRARDSCGQPKVTSGCLVYVSLDLTSQERTMEF